MQEVDAIEQLVWSLVAALAGEDSRSELRNLKEYT